MEIADALLDVNSQHVRPLELNPGAMHVYKQERETGIVGTKAARAFGQWPRQVFNMYKVNNWCCLRMYE